MPKPTPAERKPYIVPEDEATLVLDETTPFPGAEIDVSLSIDWSTLMGVRAWLNEAADVESVDDDMEALDKRLRTAAGLFAPYLLGWNLATRHGPVPATAEGLLSLPHPQLMPAILGAWVSAVGGVAPPLPEGSNDGGQPSSTLTPASASTRKRVSRSTSRRKSTTRA